MKKKWIYYILLLLVLFCCFKKQRPITEGVIVYYSGAIEEYLSDAIWIGNDGAEWVFINSNSKKLVKIEDVLGNEDFSVKKTKIQDYYVDYYRKNLPREPKNEYPYLVIGNKRYDFLVIKEDLFTVANYNNGEPGTFTKKEKGRVLINGRYCFEGEVYHLYYSSIKGTITHEESGKTYSFTELDSERLKTYEPLFSEESVYRWWEDEEGNLILLFEGFDVSGMSKEEILNQFPVHVLEKIEE